MSSPKLEARIANISTATLNFPGELTYAGIKVIHTAQNISMLKVINLASLKLSGSFRARKARMKHNMARSPMYPSTAQKPTAEPRAHSKMILFLNILKFLKGKGGEIVNQRIHMITCTRVKPRTLSFCCVGPNHFITSLPGSVALKAINTTIVFPRTQEIQRTKVIPNAVCRSMQDHSEGRPMKVREHRKHRVKEKSSRKLSSELLALTTGVCLYLKKMNATTKVMHVPNREAAVSSAPIISSYDRNSASFFTQASLLSFDQNSGWHRTQEMESEK